MSRGSRTISTARSARLWEVEVADEANLSTWCFQLPGVVCSGRTRSALPLTLPPVALRHSSSRRILSSAASASPGSCHEVSW